MEVCQVYQNSRNSLKLVTQRFVFKKTEMFNVMFLN